MDFCLLLKILVKIYNKYSQKVLDKATKKSMTDAIKTASRRAIQTTAEATGDLIGNKIADKITKVSKTSQNNLEAVNSEEEIPKERNISPEKKEQIVDELKLEQYYNNRISKNNKFVRQYIKSTIKI